MTVTVPEPNVPAHPVNKPALNGAPPASDASSDRAQQLRSLVKLITEASERVISGWEAEAAAQTADTTARTFPPHDLYEARQVVVSAGAMLVDLVQDPQIRILELGSQYYEARALHIAVVALGRYAFARPPEWLDDEQYVRLDQATGMAKMLVEHVVSGEDLDVIWMGLNADDDEEEDRYVGRFYRARGGSGDASNPGSVSHSNSGSFASGMRRRPGVEALSSANGGGSANGNAAANEVPVEYKAEVDRVFFEFLNKICSNRT